MRVYIHGNCQASAIGWMLGEVRPDWDIVSREVHTFDISAPEVYKAYRQQVSQADLIFAQPIADGYRSVDFLSLNWIRANMGSSAKLRIFPSIYFRGYNPQSFDLHMDGHIMGYHDVHVADMFLAGIAPQECHERIASSTFFTREFVLSEFFLSLRGLAQRERAAGVDAAASGIILDAHQGDLLFHTFNHPARSLLRGVIDQLMQSAGHRIEIPAGGRSYLDNIRIVPYRSLALHLGLRPETLPEMGKMIRLGIVESLRDYVEAAYECYRLAGAEGLRERIAAYPDAGAYLRRFHGSAQGGGVGLDADKLILGLFRTLLGREPAWPEVQYWVSVLAETGSAEVVQRFVGSDEFRDRQRRGTGD